MFESSYNNYDSLVDLISKSDKSYDLDIIDKAYKCALKTHGDQKRVSGVPYILHPVSVAYILVRLGMDTQTIAAALLHDVLEDTDFTAEEMEKEFGKEIFVLVSGVTNLGRVPYSSKEEQQAKNIRKMLIAMSKDIRVIIIKLADRLQNMRTIECMPEQKRRDKSLENMEVFAPIAHRLGIRAIKEELEDISLKYLDPVAYREIQHSLALKKDDREDFLELIKNKIYDRISKFIPNIHVEGRVKSANGIYRKMFVKGKVMEEIYDIYAVRVIVDTVNDCYNILGLVHEMFQPIPNRFKDYISIPKLNMYQSLHTTVLGKEGIPFEVQIRTWEMHRTAEYGIAAHWKYKLGISGSEDFLEEYASWVHQILDNQKETGDATDVISSIKLDLAPEEVFVLTPKGKVVSLPMGATVIDFAYAIHTEIGNKMIGAKVDKRIVPITYKVKTGEIVDIIISRDRNKGPSRDWIKIVRTSEAKTKIKQWFKRERRDENIIEGNLEVEKELRRNNISVSGEELQKILEPILRRNQFKTLSDFYASVGYGGIQLWRVIPRIKEEYIKLKNINRVKPKVSVSKVDKSNYNSVVVDNMNNCLIRFSKCCNPVPGDNIVGFITRGYGVSIHKRSCPNVPQDLNTCNENERWVNSYWACDDIKSFKAMVNIRASDRCALIADIANELAQMNLSINEISSRVNKENIAIINISIKVKNVQHLNAVIKKLYSVESILSISRA